jgi:hypothetical protein
MARHTGEDGQLTFDALFHTAAVEAAPPWQGAPLGFTTDYYPPAELDAAFGHWQFLHAGELGAYAASHMWHRAITVPAGVELGTHRFDLFTADLRCEPWNHEEPHGACLCLGDLIYQAICEPCRWHIIGDSENAPVEAWHDHAVPGWRDLPTVPAHIPISDGARLTKTARAWISEHYPPDVQVPGAPIITERSHGGHRHVPGRSPWGGYDLSHTTTTDPKSDSDRRITPKPVASKATRRRRVAPPEADPSPATRRGHDAAGGRSLGD